MKKQEVMNRTLIITMFVMTLFLLIFASLTKDWVLICGFVVSFLLLSYIIYTIRTYKNDISALYENIEGVLSPTQYRKMNDLPLPVIVAKRTGEVLWYNKIFHSSVLVNHDIIGEDLYDMFPAISLDENTSDKGINVEYNEKMYTAYSTPVVSGKNEFSIIYLVDDDKLKRIAKEYYHTKPCVAVFLVDNYDEIAQVTRESERTQVMSEVACQIENYVLKYNGLIEKVYRDKFVAVIEDEALRQMIEDKFSLLDEVRKINVNERLNVTLSVGISRVKDNLANAKVFAKQGLDMALGRGGDQVALKTESGYNFFGGVSKGIEKRTKVKTRIVAKAMLELLNSSDNVLIMGHRFSDLDCLGAAVGLYGAIKRVKPDVNIIFNSQKTMAKPLYNDLCENGYTEAFITPEKALTMINDKTLLIIVDTHIPSFVESKEVYEACKNIMVIDHHRKMVEYIDNAVIFFHEPYASSASEMVAELVQYLGSASTLTPKEAEAVLSGIMLDTKNFILKTGVRTFEAAAYLRKLGADTIEVKKLFATSMSTYQGRTNLVSEAEVYKNCATVFVDGNGIDNIKIIAPQTADELLNIKNVKCSFVVYLEDGTINISARSYGEVNVQLIMEKLGGGGHLTMAGTQIDGISLEEARAKLLESIDSYFDSLVTQE